MKFKDSKLFIKLLSNYEIQRKSSPEDKLSDFLDNEYYYAYTGKRKPLKDGYYPNKIFLIGYFDDGFKYIVFRKKV